MAKVWGYILSPDTPLRFLTVRALQAAEDMGPYPPALPGRRPSVGTVEGVQLRALAPRPFRLGPPNFTDRWARYGATFYPITPHYDSLRFGPYRPPKTWDRTPQLPQAEGLLTISKWIFWRVAPFFVRFQISAVGRPRALALRRPRVRRGPRVPPEPESRALPQGPSYRLLKRRGRPRFPRKTAFCPGGCGDRRRGPTPGSSA